MSWMTLGKGTEGAERDQPQLICHLLLQHLMYFGSKIWIFPFGKIAASGNKKYLEWEDTVFIPVGFIPDVFSSARVQGRFALRAVLREQRNLHQGPDAHPREGIWPLPEGIEQKP